MLLLLRREKRKRNKFSVEGKIDRTVETENPSKLWRLRGWVWVENIFIPHSQTEPCAFLHSLYAFCLARTTRSEQSHPQPSQTLLRVSMTETVRWGREKKGKARMNWKSLLNLRAIVLSVSVCMLLSWLLNENAKKSRAHFNFLVFPFTRY